MSAVSKSRHVVSLATRTPHVQSPAGSITRVDADVLPLMHRLSIRRALIAPGSLRTPHWHANAHELGYCVRGETRVTIANNHSARDGFVVGAGEMFFVPSGAAHAIENVGPAEAELVLAFSSERVEDFTLADTFGVMSNAVLANTYDLKSSDFVSVPHSLHGKSFNPVERTVPVAEQERHVNPLKFSIESSMPQIASGAGEARLSKADLWPALKDMAMFSISITDRGMREPHWHPGTAEMGYITAGHGRMTILDPDGAADTYRIEPGDTYFIPRAYPHDIENTGEEPLRILVFFDQPAPGDIGLKGLGSAFSRETLAAALDIPLQSLPALPFTAVDPLIVPRGNPLDAG